MVIIRRWLVAQDAHTGHRTLPVRGCQQGGHHTRHILPPSEIYLGLFWADFKDWERKHLFRRIG